MNIFLQLAKSLYSPKDIAKFRFQGIGKTILYVFFLCLLSIIPSAGYFSTAIVNGSEAIQSAFAKLPDFTIENGELTSKQQTPITITENNFTVIFDTTGAIDKSDLEDSDNTFAFLKDEFVFIAGGSLNTYSYSMLYDVSITRDDVLGFLSTVHSTLGIIIPIFIAIIYLFTSGVKFIEITILAWIGLLLKNLAGKNTPYRQLWRLSAYSITLPTIFFTIMAAIKTDVPNGFLINWFVSIIVLLLTLKEIPGPKKKVPQA